MIRSTKGQAIFYDIRWKCWTVRRSMCRHYYASQDGVNFTRCKLTSIACVMAITTDATLKLILGEK